MRHLENKGTFQPITTKIKMPAINGGIVDWITITNQAVVEKMLHDNQMGILETKRLWISMDRPRAFFLPSLGPEDPQMARHLLMKRSRVNVTLLFAVVEFCKVVKAYFDEIEKLLAKGIVIQNVNNVASYFVSCIESMVDSLLETCLLQGGAEAETANRLLSDIATASSKQACEIYKETFDQDSFHNLETMIERSKQLLWSCICSKNPLFSEIKYLKALMDSERLHYLPMQTLVVYRVHGETRRRLAKDLKETLFLLERLQQLGMSACNFPQREEDKADDPFQKPFNKLVEIIAVGSKKANLIQSEKQ